MLTPDFSKPNITNIVSTVDLNCDLKLNEISSKITNSTYIIIIVIKFKLNKFIHLIKNSKELK